MEGKIHAPYTKFKGWLTEKGITYADVAQDLCLSVSTVSLKINGYSDFYLAEIQVLMDKYELTSDIFLF